MGWAGAGINCSASSEVRRYVGQSPKVSGIGRWLFEAGRRQSCRPLVGRPHRSQPRFGLIKEGVNLLHVVARSGSRELLAVRRMPRQRGSPDPEELVANSVEEGVDLRRV